MSLESRFCEREGWPEEGCDGGLREADICILKAKANGRSGGWSKNLEGFIGRRRPGRVGGPLAVCALRRLSTVFDSVVNPREYKYNRIRLVSASMNPFTAAGRDPFSLPFCLTFTRTRRSLQTAAATDIQPELETGAVTIVYSVVMRSEAPGSYLHSKGFIPMLGRGQAGLYPKWESSDERRG